MGTFLNNYAGRGAALPAGGGGAVGGGRRCTARESLRAPLAARAYAL